VNFPKRSASNSTKYNYLKLEIFTKKCMTGGQCVPACHIFPCKKTGISNFYTSFNFLVKLHNTSLFAKFGIANLFMDPIFHLIRQETVSVPVLVSKLHNYSEFT